MKNELEAIREAEIAADLRRLGSAAGAQGGDVVASVRDLYEIYKPEAIDWIGGLYDREACAFYYSESARDNEPYFPDAESTKQALSFFTSSGLAREVGGYQNMFPEGIRRGFIRFAKSMQDENGYFYHPGWGKERTDKVITRRSRDLGWCTSMLRDFGAMPTYPTPNGYEGDYIDAFGRPVSGKCEKTEKNERVAEPKIYAENLRSAEAFRAYLGTKDIENRSYHACSELITQAGQIVERDRLVTEACGGERLMDILISWLDAHQHPESGHWHPVSNYYAVNGLYKAARIYNAAGLAMPYAEAAVRSAMEAITSGEAMGAVVDIFNSWSAISYLLDNQRRYGGEEGERLIRRVTHELRAEARTTLGVTKEKLSGFLKADGSFSYCPDRSAHVSAGMPVAVPYTDEGDVNATTIAISGVAGSIFSSLGLSEAQVRIYTSADRERLLALMGAT